MKRVIMHVDMDAFFASVEQLDHAEYRGRPVIVGGLERRGVVSTASYEARKYGVHSAMPMSVAKGLCPQGIFVSGNYRRYQEVSAEIFGIFAAFSPLVEPLSIDEAFLDITGMEKLAVSPRDYAVKLKAMIREKTGLVASVGIAPNKFMAKIASDLEKPDGLVVIEEAEVLPLLDRLPLPKLWGVGKKSAARLKEAGFRYIGDLRQADEAYLSSLVGQKNAQKFQQLARGIDERAVTPSAEAKSIGKEVTFPADIYAGEQLQQELLLLAEKVGWRLRCAGKKAQTIQLKVRLGDFTTYTRSKTLRQATCFDEVLYQTARELLAKVPLQGGVRLLGISGSNFAAAEELTLFAAEEKDSRKKEQLYTAVDALKKRFGEEIIRHLGAKK